MRIGIIGMGWVGSSVAASVLHAGIARELVVSDVRAELAEGEALDLAHGTPFLAPVRVRAGTPESMRDFDAVVVAAGRGGKPGETRLDLLRENAKVARSIARDLRGLRGLLVVVSNPVDVLTHVMLEASDLPPERVIGTGTLLDTARLRQMVGEAVHIEPRSIHAQVVGEHGDSEVALFSSARIAGRPLRELRGWTPELEREIGERVRCAAYEIISRKGATNHAIGVVTAALLTWALRDERRVVTVSSLSEERGVTTSVPVVLGAAGVVERFEPAMDAAESARFEASCDRLRASYASVATSP